MICTFFGHRDTPSYIRKLLVNTITDLIEKRKVDIFYVGNHGGYDAMVLSVLKELKIKYPHIRYTVVLAYMAKNNITYDCNNFKDTLYPEGLETVPKRFAILKRNEWMVKNSDIIVAFVMCGVGGAAKSVDYARRQNKEIINLADIITEIE